MLSKIALPKETSAVGSRARRLPSVGSLILGVLCLLAAAEGVDFVRGTSNPASDDLTHLSCAHWDGRAAEAVAGLVRDASDVSLRAAGDALFRLRRARRNCRAGWLALSCGDYRAIVRGQSGRNLNATAGDEFC